MNGQIMWLNQTFRISGAFGLKALASIQTFCSVVSLLALLVVTNVRGEMFLPTPTCPSWISPFNLPMQTLQLCVAERVSLYEPAWAYPLFVISAGVSVICLLGTLVLQVFKSSHDSVTDTKRILKYQMLLASSMLALWVVILVFMPIIADWIPGPQPLTFK
jgi:hypothetical protein